MPTVDSTRFRWPVPWRPLTDGAEALMFGRYINPRIASTVLGELRREICDRHPLAGVACRPVASSAGGKDFLFVTDRPETPVVLVHFTWCVETDSTWPFIVEYRSLSDFVRRERRWPAEVWVGVQQWWSRVTGR